MEGGIFAGVERLPQSWALAGATFVFMLAAAAIALPWSLGIAWILVRGRPAFRGGAAFFPAVLTPLPLYFFAGAWTAGFGVRGWQAEALGGAPLLSGWSGAAWIHACAAVPWCVLILARGLRRLDPRIEEQGKLLHPPWRIELLLILPQLAPSLAAAACLTMLVAGSEVVVTDVFQVPTFAETIYVQLAADPDPRGALAALRGAWWTQVGLVVVAAVLVAGWRRPPWEHDPDAPPSASPVGRPRLVDTFLAWGSVLVLFGVPFGNLVYQAGMHAVPGPDGPIRTYYLAKAGELMLSCWFRVGRDGTLEAGEFLPETLRSLLLAACVAAAVVPTALAAAWFVRRRPVLETALWGTVVLAGAVPAPLLGLLTALVCNQPGWPLLHALYDRSIFAPVLVQAVRTWPWAAAVLIPAAKVFPESLLDQARTAGLSPLRLATAVLLPAFRRPLLLAAGLVAAVSLGELGATIVVAPPGFQLLSLRAFNLLHYGLDDLVAAYYLSLACIAAFAWAIYSVVRRVLLVVQDA